MNALSFDSAQSAGDDPTVDELTRFRAEVQAFLAERLSPELAERSRAGYYLSKSELQGWHRALYERGWAGINWPASHGGPGWSPIQKFIFEDECAKAGAPILIMIALNQVAALLIAAGTEAQQRRFLPGILDGSDLWCQGFSEPNSGSDLASLKCPARLVTDPSGDYYLVEGDKIWTTAAHWSNWCFLLVRTASDGPKQEGITILLVDMNSPGITVRPIIGLDGMHSLNQVFFDQVRVPVAHRVGEEGKGWGLMKLYLGHERISAAGVWKCRAHLSRLVGIATRTIRSGRRLIDDPRFAEKLAWLEIRLRALEVILQSVINDPDGARGVMAAVLKLRGTELTQELLLLISEAAGPYALPFHQEVLRAGWGDTEPIGPEFAAPATPAYFFWRKATISGGSSEIMKNLIAQSLF